MGTSDLVDLYRFFPALPESSHQKTSQKTSTYNCIAWAAGDDQRWWWPDWQGIAFWPATASREETLEAFIEAYGGIGYEICDSEEPLEGMEKVAIYTLHGTPTHAARQLPNGKWTSKCGDLEDIEHELSALEGRYYGTVAAVLQRARAT
jgi:hypothetical protein